MNQRAVDQAQTETPLFRAEALRQCAGTPFGSVMIAAPASFALTTAAFTLFAIALVCALLWGRYTQRETVEGFIAVPDGEIRVYPHSSGTVADILVAEGETVEAGAPLFALMTSRNSQLAASANTEIVDGLLAESAALDIQMQEQARYFAKESQRLARVVERSAGMIGILREQLALATRKMELANRNLDRAKTVRSQGYIAVREYDAVTASAIDSEMDAGVIRFRIGEWQANRDDAGFRLGQLENQQRTTMADLARESERLAQRLVVTRAAIEQVVVAPASGQVSAILVSRGQAVQPDTLAINLVARSAVFHAELLVPGRSIGMLDSPSRVELRFDAYPYEKYGTFGATIEQVAETLLFPGDARLPVSITEPVYRVRAVLGRQFIDTGESERRLTAGLVFKADVLLGERTLLEWMLAPVTWARMRP